MWHFKDYATDKQKNTGTPLAEELVKKKPQQLLIYVIIKEYYRTRCVFISKYNYSLRLYII